MFGFSKENLTDEKRAILRDYKHLIYEALLEAITMGVTRQSAAMLVDEEFGERIHEEARKEGIIRILTVEKSGQDEVEFEYGSRIAQHIEKFKPEYVKALVYYNPEYIPANDRELNKHQIEMLKIIQAYCQSHDYNFLVEILTPPTAEQLTRYNNSEEKYEKTMHAQLMRQSIKELQEGGIEPDLWKVEGLESEEQMRSVVAQARAKGRENVGVVILGRGEDKARVENWLKVGAKITGVIGFAVGRTVWAKPLLAYHQRAISRQEATHAIAKNYKYFVDLFLSVR